MPKISELDLVASLTADDLIVLLDAPGGSPETKAITASNAQGFLGAHRAYPLYAITGYTATLPAGETLLATYASMAALRVAVVPASQGQRIQVALGPRVEVYQARLLGATLDWQSSYDVAYSITGGGALTLSVAEPMVALSRVPAADLVSNPATVTAPSGHTIGAGQSGSAGDNVLTLNSNFSDIVWLVWNGSTNWAIRTSVAGGERALYTNPPPYRPLPSVANSAALPATGQVLHDYRVVDDTKRGWLYTQSTAPGSVNGWIDMGLATVPVPLPLYAIAGHGAILPPGETLIATFASLAALNAAIGFTGQSQRIQVATAGQVTMYETRFVSGVFSRVAVV